LELFAGQMNISDIEKYGESMGVEIAKIYILFEDDSKTIIMSPRAIIRQMIEKSIKEHGKGKLYIFDKLSSDWLKDDPPNLPYKFSS